MAATKPQIRSVFATPVCVHFHPVAQEANGELRPLILEKAQNHGNNNYGEGWRSPADFESWGGDHAQTRRGAQGPQRQLIVASDSGMDAHDDRAA